MFLAAYFPAAGYSLLQNFRMASEFSGKSKSSSRRTYSSLVRPVIVHVRKYSGTLLMK
jgi:hypothetical protein